MENKTSELPWVKCIGLGERDSERRLVPAKSAGVCRVWIRS
jgi:hypothetical protein